MSSRPLRRAPAWAAAALCTGLWFVAPGAARAEPDPEQAAISAEATAEVRDKVASETDEAAGRVAQGEQAVLQLERRRDSAKADLDAVTDRATDARNRVSEMDRQLTAKDEEVSETRRRLERAATELWIAHAGEVVDESPSDAYVTKVRRDTYGRATGEVPRDLIEKFSKERKTLAVLRDRADDARAAIELERRAAEQAVTELDALVDAARGLLLTEAAKLERWRKVASAPATPIMSASLLSAEEMAGWFQSTGRVARLGTDDQGGPMDIEKLARYYIEEGNRYGVRGDVAFAQGIHETGYFGFPDYGQVRPGDNNFAGIGACNSCANGYGYPNARIGVRAQMQLLRNYSDPNISEATLPDGDKALFANYDRFFLRGAAPVWTGLNGRWAVPGSTYGQAIHRTYLSMYTWAVDNRTPSVAPPPRTPTTPATPAATVVPGTPPGGVLTRPATPVGR